MQIYRKSYAFPAHCGRKQWRERMCVFRGENFGILDVEISFNVGFLMLSDTANISESFLC